MNTEKSQEYNLPNLLKYITQEQLMKMSLEELNYLNFVNYHQQLCILKKIKKFYPWHPWFQQNEKEQEANAANLSNAPIISFVITEPFDPNELAIYLEPEKSQELDNSEDKSIEKLCYDIFGNDEIFNTLNKPSEPLPHNFKNEFAHTLITKVNSNKKMKTEKRMKNHLEIFKKQIEIQKKINNF